MPELSAKSLCWTVVWLSIFIVAVITSVLPLYAFLPGFCEITSDPFKEDSKDGLCYLKVEVHVSANDTDEEFSASAFVEKDTRGLSMEYFNCSDKGNVEFPKELQKGQAAPCWYIHNDHEDVRFFKATKHDDLTYAVRFSDILNKAALAVSVVFGLFFIISLVHIFRFELMRCCPRLVLRMWVNANAFFTRRGSSTRLRTQNLSETTYVSTSEESVSRPPMTSSCRRISSLIENAKLSDEEVRMLYAEGWSCCICLDVGPESGRFPAVSRLPCGHATHSECLRSWLEKGRAVCCLCNADVFSDESKDATGSAGASTVSGYDTGSPGSLEVERTDGAPSSPATSMFADMPQQSSFHNSHSHDQDREV